MIGQLRGIITHIDDRFAVLDVGGVGYKVWLTSDTIAGLTTEPGEVAFWIHTAVREDSIDLYGFPTRPELRLFEMLIGVSGIGPKSALGVLSVAPIATIQNAIASGDTSYLTKVSGIGKKNAEKIIIELKDKVAPLAEKDAGRSLREELDVIEALRSLGYSATDARDALQKVPSGVAGTNKRLSEALKLLGKP